jgi:hypothetical protein
MRIALFVLIFLGSSLFFFTQGSYSKEPHEDLMGWNENERSNQVLHRRSQNKSYRLSPESIGFVEKNFRFAQPAISDSEVLRIGSDYVSIDGEFLVFGVGSGQALNFLAALNPTETIYGFDSFKHKKAVTPFLHNVKIIEGQFKKSLPHFSQMTLLSRQVAFLYINCHSYKSTKEVFLWLRDHLADRSVIVFDEFYNFPGYENEEYKAFQEFLVDNQFDVEYLSYNTENEQVAVRLVKRW